MKRTRSQAFAEELQEDEEMANAVTVDEPDTDADAQTMDKEKQVWESVREEHFEGSQSASIIFSLVFTGIVIDQVPLTLHRQYALMEELDQQTHGYLDDIVPTLRKYVAYRRNVESGATTTTHTVPLPTPPTPIFKTPVRPLLHPTGSSTPNLLSLPAERTKPPETGREMLSHVAWLAEELMGAAQEKVNLAQAAHDYISRQIQVLAQSIKEQEASIALGTRPGTQLAPILLPDVAPPSRWTKGVAGTLVLDEDPENAEDAPTTVGVVVEETEQPQPTKRRGGRKGKRPAIKPSEGSGAEQNTSLKITLPAMDNRLYCYCHKPSAGEMVACDNEECENQWFHLSCIGLATLPEEDETWYCQDCDPIRVPLKKRGRKR
ncbi:hypothetical protein D9757_001658 [Collybiopsis confluens]|uniref:Chromatin modification-related protein n=1 Tax=Collybiopsis confluens TaxID=2823264 RepID=A0A8H5HZ80_9AGAR|nr:hypothetical protein D9757_001658 [Collybiopsis confluens]